MTPTTVPPVKTRDASSGLTLDADDAVDLHLHTLASDGFWKPRELVDYLADNNFRVAAVCDHDTQRSVLEAIEQGERRGVRVIPGIEVTVRWADRQWHLLVYGIRPDAEQDEARPFLDLVDAQDQRLQDLARDARQRVEASGRPLPSLASIHGDRVMWPVHVLQAMIKDRHVPRLKEAAELVVALGGNFTTDVPLEDVVPAVRRAGGVTVLAHPGRPDLGPALNAEVLDRMLEVAPIDGLEAHYRTYTDDDTALYRQLAAERGLLASTGSDSHAPKTPVDPRAWRAIWARELLGRLGIEVRSGASDEVWAPGMDPLAIKPPDPAKEAEQEAKEPVAAS